MLLAVDVGNTQTHVGLFEGEELLEHWRLHTARTATADELAMVRQRRCCGLREPAPVRRRGGDGLVRGARAGPGVRPADRSATSAASGALVGPEIRKTDMPIRIDNPRELGADRLANAIAAYERIGGACIAVDFGTAINYDVVSAEGEYLGGVISPGSRSRWRRSASARPRCRRCGSRRAACGDRQGHARGHPVRRGLRLRGPGRRPGGAPARGAGRRGHRDRHRRLRGA